MFYLAPVRATSWIKAKCHQRRKIYCGVKEGRGPASHGTSCSSPKEKRGCFPDLQVSAFPDGAEILFKLSYPSEENDAAVNKTYINLGTKNREI